MVPGGFACVVDCSCGAVDSRKHLARPRTSASGGRQGAWWHDAATQADARMQAGADVPAESAKRCAGGLCMWHCIELRSGGRKRLRGVRGVHGSCCGATNGGGDGFGVSLVETPGSAGCNEREGRTPLEGPGCAFCETGVSRVVKGTASPDVTVRKLTSTFLRAVKRQSGPFFLSRKVNFCTSLFFRNVRGTLRVSSLRGLFRRPPVVIIKLHTFRSRCVP